MGGDGADRQFETKYALIILFGLSALAIGLIFFESRPSAFPSFYDLTTPLPRTGFRSSSEKVVGDINKIQQFISKADFDDYLIGANIAYQSVLFDQIKLSQDLGVSSSVGSLNQKTEDTASQRIFEANIRMLGIDELDTVKTDGKEIYAANGNIKNIKSFPADQLAIDGKIENNGNLLLVNNNLIVFSSNKIVGYDVADPKNPKQVWEASPPENNNLITARLYQDKIYLVSQTKINLTQPCPYSSLSIKGNSVDVACTDIYHSEMELPIDVIYNLIVIDPTNGEKVRSASLVGSSENSMVYMSSKAIYLTYFYPGDFVGFISNFFDDNQDIVPLWLIERLNSLRGYNISNNVKLIELQALLDQYYNNFTSDERLKRQNEIANRLNVYYALHNREIEQTGIVKINSSDLVIGAVGSVPGKLLNQFSLDEYQGDLRLATMVGGNWLGIGFSVASGGSLNDVCVLDSNLKLKGVIRDLGKEERIYSARFIEDKAYLVTSEETNPFFIIDLSRPDKPELKGELTIFGYSSYLYPITKDKILGIGRENDKVRISLFDVFSPTNPVEIAKHNLNERWSGNLNTYQAFSLDDKHQIFFLPGIQGGYVFGYQGNNLTLLKTVSDISVRRTIYLDDYLYIIGDKKIVVLSEKDWQQVNKLDF